MDPMVLFVGRLATQKGTEKEREGESKGERERESK
jgi:hypothetical protein